MSADVATIGLGSNVGDRASHLACALAALRDHPRLVELGVSACFETEHVGSGSQRAHWNACARYRTTLEPDKLLDELQRIERAAGREPDGHGRPRTLDLDLLLYDARRMNTQRLRLPHPRMAERHFVLAPLAELCPELVIEGRSIAERLRDPRILAQRVRRLDAAVLQSKEARA